MRLGRGGRSGPIFFSDHVEGHGREMLATLCERKFEGIIAKLATAPYRPVANADWLKVKCALRQELVIAGTSPSDRSRPFASLLLGVQGEEGPRLCRPGRLGLLDRTARRSSRRSSPSLRRKTVALCRQAARRGNPGRALDRAQARRRDRVCRLYEGPAGSPGPLRGPQGRQGAEEVVAEKPKPVAQEERLAEAGPRRTGRPSRSPQRRRRPRQAGQAKVAPRPIPRSFSIPPRRSAKETSRPILAMVAPHMLPFIERRLVSLVRCPDGTQKACFFQRHRSQGMAESFALRRRRRRTATPRTTSISTASKASSPARRSGAGAAYLGLEDRRHRAARPSRLRPRSGRGRRLLRREGCRAEDARCAGGHRPRELSAAHRRQGRPCRRAARAASATWPVIKATARALAEYFADRRAGPLRRDDDQGQARRQDLHRSLPQRARLHRRRAVLHCARATEHPSPGRALERPAASRPSPARSRSSTPPITIPTGWEGYRRYRQGISDAALSALGVKAR